MSIRHYIVATKDHRFLMSGRRNPPRFNIDRAYAASYVRARDAERAMKKLGPHLAGPLRVTAYPELPVRRPAPPAKTPAKTPAKSPAPRRPPPPHGPIDPVVIRVGGSAFRQAVAKEFERLRDAGHDIPEPRVTDAAAPAPADWAGRVVLMEGEWRSDARTSTGEKYEHGRCERYGEVTYLGGDFLVIQYRGHDHTFCRNTGLPLESPFGDMRHYRVAEHEMHRFRPAKGVG